MKFTSELNERTWAIRRAAAAKWNCPCSEIIWGLCLKMAKAEMEETMKETVKYQTPRGAAVTASIRNESLFRLEVKNTVLNDIILDGELFKTRHPVNVNGKKMMVTIPATPESIDLYNLAKKRVMARVAMNDAEMRGICPHCGGYCDGDCQAN